MRYRSNDGLRGKFPESPRDSRQVSVQAPLPFSPGGNFQGRRSRRITGFSVGDRVVGELGTEDLAKLSTWSKIP